jgi:hypothetical protein
MKPSWLSSKLCIGNKSQFLWSNVRASLDNRLNQNDVFHGSLSLEKIRQEIDKIIGMSIYSHH